MMTISRFISVILFAEKPTAAILKNGCHSLRQHQINWRTVNYYRPWHGLSSHIVLHFAPGGNGGHWSATGLYGCPDEVQ